VKLKNYRSYGNSATTIRFAPGLNVLLGRIGSGKSSILESMLICLFGFNRSGVRRKDVLRRDATAESLQIETTFFYDNVHFRVARGGETRLESSPDGLSWTLISENSNEINDFIESTLEVSARKFRDLFYSAQGELTNVITGSPEERQKSIDKLLGAESLRETYDRLSEFMKHFDEDVGKARGKLENVQALLRSQDLDELRESKRTLEEEVIRINQRIAEISKEITSGTKELEGLRSQVKPLEDALGQIEELSRQLTREESELGNRQYQIEATREEISRLSQEAEERRRELEGLVPQEKEVSTRLKGAMALRQQLSEMRNRIAGMVDREKRLRKNILAREQTVAVERQREATTAKEIEAVESSIESLETEIKKTEEGITAAKGRLEDTASRTSSLEGQAQSWELKASTLHQSLIECAERIRRLNSLEVGAACPLCDQPISPSHRGKVVAQLEEEGRRISAEEDKARAEEKRIREILRQIERERESAQREIDDLGEKLAELREDSVRQKQKREGLLRNLSDLKERRAREERELEAEKEELKVVLEDLEAERKASGIEGENWMDLLDSRLEKLRKEEEEIRGRLTELSGMIRSARDLLQKALEGKEKREKTLGELGSDAQRLQDGISQIKARMTSIYRPLVGEAEDPRSELNERISHLNSRIEELRERIKAAEIERTDRSGEYRRKEDQISRLTEQIETYLENQRKAEGFKRTVTVYSEARNILQQIRDKYKDAREMIRTNLVNVLREILQVEFKRLYSYEDFDDVKVSDDYEVSLQSPVGEIQAHNLSAGQKAIVAIAFRLAVAKAMEMKIGCWIIDEPTQNIGDTEVEALAGVLADTKEIPQIIVASHHPALGRYGNVISLEMTRGQTILTQPPGQADLPPRAAGGVGGVNEP